MKNNNTTTAYKELVKANNMISVTTKNVFGTADLWNIQRQVKTAFARRRVL